jgi:uncharacterized protein
MILSFSVSNFRSFDKEATVSAIASRRVQNEHEQHLVAIPGSDEKALPILVLYGANGAGKSNLVRGLEYLRGLALNLSPVDGRTGRVTFFRQEGEPTSLDLTFLADGMTFRYGVELSSSEILSEWLLRIEGSREGVIYERSTHEAGVTVSVGKGIEGNEKFNGLAVAGCRPHQTFLSTALSTLGADAMPDILRGAVKWLHALSLVGPESGIANLSEILEKNAALREFASGVLRRFSTGVDQLVAVRRSLTPDEAATVFSPQHIAAAARNPDETVIAALPDGTQIQIESVQPWQAFQYSLRAAHRKADGSIVQLGLGEESDGTRRLLHLAPTLFELRSQASVFVVDEMDRSLHPNLLFAFLESYLSEPNPHASQLIVTTHESHLLDTALLRRDEIWFAEKDNGGATSLYSLSDFQVRKDLSIRKHYLQGRFGAIPFLGDPSQLIPKSSAD